MKHQHEDSYIALSIKQVERSIAADRIRRPLSISASIFNRALDVVLRYTHYEGRRTGALVVLSNRRLQWRPLSSEECSLKGRNICEDGIEGPLRLAFSLDGGILVDGETGEILRGRADFYPLPSGLVLDGYGTRHRKALDIAADQTYSAVTLSRSQDGSVTVFSAEHLTNIDCAVCHRIKDSVEEQQYPIIMPHTPLVRFDTQNPDKIRIPAGAKEALQKLEVPVRVVAFVGPGRTGKSTLAGSIVGDQGIFPSARATGAVTEGINAAAVRHPSGGSIIMLDGEGYDNPLAPSRSQIGTLCIMLSSLVINVDFDRLNDHQLASLSKLIACGEVISSVSQTETSPARAAPQLLVVVNGSRFHDQYNKNTLEDALACDPSDGERSSTRKAINSFRSQSINQGKNFPKRSFISIPINSDIGFEPAVAQLREIVQTSVQPLMHCGQPFDGAMFFTLFDQSVRSLNTSGRIEAPSMFNNIVGRHLEVVAVAAFDKSVADYPIWHQSYRDNISLNEGEYLRGLVHIRSSANHAILTKIQAELREKMDAHFQQVQAFNKERGEEVLTSTPLERKVEIESRRSYEKKAEWKLWSVQQEAGPALGQLLQLPAQSLVLLVG